MNQYIKDDFNFRSASPNRCYLTGLPKADGDEGVIGTGVLIEGEGELDISFEAVRTLARMIGWESPEEVETRRASLYSEVEYQKAVAADAVAQFQLKEAELKAERAAHAKFLAELERANPAPAKGRK